MAALVVMTGWFSSLSRSSLEVEMIYNTEFDVDSVLETLRTLDEKHQEGSPEDEALRVAAVALIYIRGLQKLDEYRDFFRKFHTPATESIVPAHSFETREDADEWLASGQAREGALVWIAGEGFRVIPQWRGEGLRFRPAPLPEELMKMRPPDSK